MGWKPPTSGVVFFWMRGLMEKKTCTLWLFAYLFIYLIICLFNCVHYIITICLIIYVSYHIYHLVYVFYLMLYMIIYCVLHRFIIVSIIVVIYNNWWRTTQQVSSRGFIRCVPVHSGSLDGHSHSFVCFYLFSEAVFLGGWHHFRANGKSKRLNNRWSTKTHGTGIRLMLNVEFHKYIDDAIGYQQKGTEHKTWCLGTADVLEDEWR